MAIGSQVQVAIRVANYSIGPGDHYIPDKQTQFLIDRVQFIYRRVVGIGYKYPASRMDDQIIEQVTPGIFQFILLFYRTSLYIKRMHIRYGSITLFLIRNYPQPL